MTQQQEGGQHSAIPVVFKWLDDTFYGVHIADDFVVVPLTPDTPFMVGVAEAPDAGTLFDVRVPYIRQVPLTPELYRYAALGIESPREGYIRVVPDAGGGFGTLELRYCVAVNAFEKNALVQLGLRMSKMTDDLGSRAQQDFGGVLVKGAATS